MILLVPTGNVEAGLLHHLADLLNTTFNLPCRLRDQIRPPTRAYGRSRGPYIAMESQAR